MNASAIGSTIRLTWRERLSILSIWAGLGLLESAKAWINRRFTPQPVSWGTVLVGNMPWWLMWAVLTPLVIALARRVRPDRGRLVFALTHLLSATLLSLVHHVVVGALYFHTHTRGQLAQFGGEPVEMTLALQFRIFFNVYFLLNVLTYFAMLAGYYGVEFYKRYREGELRAARLEAGMQRARLAALRMELNPHFLFNTLNAVAGLVRRHERDGAIRMLARLSELLRSTLEQENDLEVPLEKELELLSSYLEIEQIRFGERLEVEVVAAAASRAAMVPPLILQPLVENAVKHGVARHTGRARVEILATLRGDDLELSVSNSGPAEESSSPLLTATHQNGGIGLTNTRQRLAELYGNRGVLTLEALAEGGARAVIRLPVRSGSGDVVLVGGDEAT